MDKRKRLIKGVYEVDPLVCAKCGGQMKIISFIERGQRDVVERILRGHQSGAMVDDPQASDLWRLIDQHFDSFRQVYDQRFADKYGFWRPVVDHSVTAFLACRDLQQGFARVRCPDCHHEMFVAYSCKQRCTWAMRIKRV